MLRCNCGGHVKGSEPDHGPQRWVPYEYQACGAEGTSRLCAIK